MALHITSTNQHAAGHTTQDVKSYITAPKVQTPVHPTPIFPMKLQVIPNYRISLFRSASEVTNATSFESVVLL